MAEKKVIGDGIQRLLEKLTEKFVPGGPGQHSLLLSGIPNDPLVLQVWVEVDERAYAMNVFLRSDDLTRDVDELFDEIVTKFDAWATTRKES